ncbi:serine/threonine protein kinase [Corallococcus exiguus]|uniref:serine/threonine-protein kinase n=1 Tax=Corallococcus exiguus TaxID=83462 RepID=UPI0014719BC8|nr:serine/threonine-protein kinase [Corallococcus exiguus]NNC14987.1 serine/threonine protein kinase [Corallococcus exiguus]NRD57054.1 serine/threonine protein kinase [Corallococcus exiguus]NRD65807.1 serine/threonine protein kinase [Corallococcus exiguus]
MITRNPSSTVSRFLDSHLRRDAQARELSVARFMSILSAICVVVAAALGPAMGWDLTLALMGLSAVLSGYYGCMWWVLRSGAFHPAIPWLNVFIEVSIPAVVLAFDLHFKGPVYALTAPTLVIWGTLVTLAGLRSNPRLGLAAGALVAAEYLGLYFGFVRPLLPEEPLVTLGPLFICVRAFFFVATGALTATLARHFLERTRSALAALREQEVMGKYVLHERVGAGGMAEVYRATYSPEGGFEKQVALKRILPSYADDAAFVTMFRREAELCSSLYHPNIVQVFDLGRHGGTYFLAMEYVDGLPLSALLKPRNRRPLPVSAATFLAAELAGALDYLHRRTSADGVPLRLVHRDLNPPNILVSRIGEVKLSDFGIARDAMRANLTVAGSVRGKLGYMAPEQAMGKDIDGRADLFALGLTLHEALTGRRALSGHSEEVLLRAAVDQEVVPPSQLNPAVPLALDLIVMQLLQKDPEKRTPNGAALRQQLLALDGPAAPFPHGQGELGRVAREAKALTEQLTQETVETAAVGKPSLARLA